MDNDKNILVHGNGDLPERIIVLLLSIFLFIGAGLLYVRDSKPLAAITIEAGEVSEELSLRQVEEKLKEERKVRINTATAEEITMIPGIGPAISSRIVEYREKNGRFSSVDALVEVKGIGPAKLEKMREYIQID